MQYRKKKVSSKGILLQNGEVIMIITSFYQCRNYRKFYPRNKLEIVNASIDKLVSAAL
jgi:hypothetical protein